MVLTGDDPWHALNRMRSSIVPPGIQLVNVNASHMKFGTGQLTATHMKKKLEFWMFITNNQTLHLFEIPRFLDQMDEVLKMLKWRHSRVQ